MKKNDLFHRNKGLLLIPVVFFASVLLVSYKMDQRTISRPSVVTHPDWSRNAVIYEVNIRQYTPEGTFKAFEQHIPRLKEMGVDILWLMPINPIGEKNRKGSLGSYYSVKDYLAVNPEFGTLDDFKSLVNTAHENGMKVIIDWVANHTSWDNKLITEHPDFYTKNAAGSIIAPVPDWTDVADLNYDNPGLRKYMTDAMLFWVRDAGIDGFRCDVAGMVPVSFWNKAVPELRKVKPVFMLAEWETPEMHDTAFDMTYSWEFFKLMKEISKGSKTIDQIDSVLAREDTVYNSDAYRMLFTTNHDENSWNGTEYELFGDAAQTFAVLNYLLPGMPLIYSGQETGMKKRLRFFDKDTIGWDGYSLAPFYTALNRIKHNNKALFNGTAGGPLVRVHTDHEKQVYAFTREKEDNKIFAVFNISASPVSVKFYDGHLSGPWKDAFTGTDIPSSWIKEMMLNPWEYKILVRK